MALSAFCVVVTLSCRPHPTSSCQKGCVDVVVWKLRLYRSSLVVLSVLSSSVFARISLDWPTISPNPKLHLSSLGVPGPAQCNQAASAIEPRASPIESGDESLSYSDSLSSSLPNLIFDFQLDSPQKTLPFVFTTDVILLHSALASRRCLASPNHCISKPSDLPSTCATTLTYCLKSSLWHGGIHHLV
ncbi:hypothetical protein GE09DRAFT_445887 [Coniochaeta sp. 2T2.1]|nr:hypothetical protein GE09DRAFT_445887 [Coniochaeta sp. 2T2.1]